MNNPHMAYLTAAAWANSGTLRGANLRGAYLRGADLIDANLSGADLRGANLIGADLSRAYLIGANLIGADLSRAYLIGANLSGANLSGAYLRGACLIRADLLGANLSRAKYEEDTLAALIASADRMDGYTFHLFRLTDGSHKIMAGCRWFTIPDYRAHVAKEYPDTVKARETLDILDFFERRAGA